MAVAKVRIMPMDSSCGDALYRVSGVTSAEEALAIAIDEDNGDNDNLAVLSESWQRCIPCICGMEHPYDLWPAKEGERGAFYCYLVGWK